MDLITKGVIFGVALIILVTFWNLTFAPKEKKIPKNFFQYFMDKYGFSTNEDAKVFNGFFEGRAVQIRSDPSGALIQVANPRGVHLIIAKGRDISVEDIPKVNLKGLEGVFIRCNYPILVQQVLDEGLIKSLNDIDQYYFEFKNGLVIEIPLGWLPQKFEKVLFLGIKITIAIERINYLKRK